MIIKSSNGLLGKSDKKSLDTEKVRRYFDKMKKKDKGMEMYTSILIE
jgi:hypothetical protein